MIPMPRDAWSPDEVRRAVADYLDMLSHELSGSPYSKTVHRNRLLPKLRGRSAGSVERKHQNISAILIEAGLPAIDGYKPLFNYQAALRDEVLSNVSRQTDVLGLIRRIEVAVPPSSQFRELDPSAITCLPRSAAIFAWEKLATSTGERARESMTSSCVRNAFAELVEPAKNSSWNTKRKD